MNPSVRILLDALTLRFLTVKRYPVDYNHRVRSHPLPHSVLWILEEGKVEVRVDGVLYAGMPEDVLLFARGSTISCRIVSDRASIVSVNLDAEIRLLPGRNWVDLFQLPVHYPRGLARIAPNVEEMLRVEHSSCLSRLMLQGLLLQLVSQLLQPHFDVIGAREAAPLGDPRLDTIIAYISCHPAAPVDLSALCGLVELSPSYLRKLFVRTTGLPPIQFIHQWKMEQAKTSLLQSGESVHRIALRFGYEDSNYFSRLFKKTAGMSPSEYRRQHRPWIW